MSNTKFGFENAIMGNKLLKIFLPKNWCFYAETVYGWHLSFYEIYPSWLLLPESLEACTALVMFDVAPKFADTSMSVTRT